MAKKTEFGTELEAIETIVLALDHLKDTEAFDRVMFYVSSRFNFAYEGKTA